ncbi:MotA/TolQ/ExbB proton channel family protein [Sphingomonas sp. BT-65]|uniref:MotA/TolQ/ExbB proton channel family protein n=1 Tax=Sphingomonas sp. BT-65 TaxID=2989821 RepID=UPI002236A734|nr:MotA/TolQ/ExbB proton channel family protein [Sphingomonas sp. BT-65]MCW4463310.1 MotA/TolQ/ExbB proton channel family protein [Sphingomonas sp. BT-65]
MLTTILTAGAAAAPAAPPPTNFDILHAMNEGGVIAWGTATILTVMLFFSLYILFTKVFEQQKILNQYKRVRATFWNNASLREGAAKLEKDSAYRQLVDDALQAQDQYKELTDPIEAHDWLHGSLKRSEDSINSQLNGGLAFLATVGSTAPFIGLFGTVVGIFRALIKIGAAGDASIGTVAGPVGEALIMTALGLVVAVPAVLAYNWLQRRNKAIQEQMSGFANDVLGYLASDGRVRPTIKGKASAAAPKAPPVATTTAKA